MNLHTPGQSSSVEVPEAKIQSVPSRWDLFREEWPAYKRIARETWEAWQDRKNIPTEMRERMRDATIPLRSGDDTPRYPGLPALHYRMQCWIAQHLRPFRFFPSDVGIQTAQAPRSIDEHTEQFYDSVLVRMRKAGGAPVANGYPLHFLEDAEFWSHFRRGDDARYAAGDPVVRAVVKRLFDGGLTIRVSDELAATNLEPALLPPAVSVRQ